MRRGSSPAVENDTTTALSEYETAVQLRGDDPILRYDYARLLSKIGRYDDAKEQVAKAIDAEPLYAPSHLLRAMLADTDGDETAAKQFYTQYVGVAARNDPTLPKAQERLVQLQGKP